VLRPTVALCLGLSLVFACGDRAENEGQLFLARAEFVTLEGPVAERRRLLDALEALPLEDETVIAVRTACVEGHRSLIDAEVAQREATIALDRLTAGRDDVQIPREEAERIEAIIARSNQAIVESGEQLQACEDGKRNLRRGPSGQR
jgi:hypothetical protein